MKTIPPKPINENSWVFKCNKLNEMYLTHMTLQELRIFSVYLSLIDKDDESTRRMGFSLKEFSRVIGESKQQSMEYIKHVIVQLSSRYVSYGMQDDEEEPFRLCPLFIQFDIEKDEYGEWLVTLDANERAIPLLFGFQREYFKYKLWNVMQLRGKNHVRMYEILKQYEKLGRRIIQIDKLRGMLGLESGEYKVLSDFKKRVLEPCREALAKYTDITFNYEGHSKRGRKIYAIEFTISQNKDFIDQLRLEEILDLDAINKKMDEAEPLLWEDPYPVEAVDGGEGEDLIKTGHFENVILTNKELDKLTDMYGKERVDQYINKLSTYMESTGKEYVKHVAVLMQWLDDDQDKAKNEASGAKQNKVKQNRFVNFNQRDNDYAKFELLEREFLKQKLEGKQDKTE